MTETLDQRIQRSLCADIHPAISAFAKHLAEAAGAHAALFYGSNLRTGELEGVLDFYLLMPGPQVEKIWPRVSYHEWDFESTRLRAKAATMPMETFRLAAGGKLRDTTIWARFVQPSALVWSGDTAAEKAVAEAIEAAAMTATRFAAALGPDRGTEGDYWRALFQETYKAEFRVEKAGREDSILSLNRAHFDGLLPAALTAADIRFTMVDSQIALAMPEGWRADIRKKWRSRRRWGKPLNVVRLLKASTTFEGAARYAAWKVQRHTGVEVDVTPWKEKHPILAAPGVLFKVWRSRYAK
ncbi:hypothetical protein QWY75_11390 [Pontixanthobacter aestiaquae]|uniref:Phosphatidate cytidylyltransferase n=1 Tax=Pontixanthobacter aestiaquae TaxID=1509367 RepID=A0A844Z5W6_9SPHN|nr:hypothetical protein [Pontixanthobacter aestiaquae]MDN3646805.1 hypothetical protein [Pontixanthobacter aestiaquae]MXO82213.1 hypothetical protein [Pontixanthobacter aestiaquae]